MHFRTLALTLVLLAACESAPPGGSVLAPLEFQWETCQDGAEFGDAFEVDCALFAAPAHWPTGPRNVSLHVRRLRPLGADTSAPRTQLWLLQGGPGYDGDSLAPLVEPLLAGRDDLDVYVPDHRGTGQSSRLTCLDAEATDSEQGWYITLAELPACLLALQAEWGQGLAGFSSVEAGMDLGKLIESQQQPGARVWVYGVSYGTFWALQYLRQWPAQATAVVLDSVCPPGVCRFDLFDKQHDEVGQLLLDRCSQDDFCANKLTKQPWTKLAALAQKLDDGHCPAVVKAGLDRANLRRLLAALVQNGTLRLAIPPLVYRLDRCNPGDQAMLKKLAEAVLPDEDDDESPEAGYFSQALHHQIAIKEMWGGATPAQLEAELATLLFAFDQGRDLAQAAQLWPQWSPPATGLPNSQVPVLILAGGLDPQTPAAFGHHVQQTMGGVPNRYLVEVPDAAHGLLAAHDLPTFECARQLMFAWLEQPDSPPDSTCVQGLGKLNFKFGGLVLGWDETGPGQPLRVDPTPHLERLRRRLARGPTL